MKSYLQREKYFEIAFKVVLSARCHNYKLKIEKL